MSAYEYTSPPTVTIGGVRVPIEGVTFDALRAADPHAEAVTTVLGRRGFDGGPHRVEFTIADSGQAFDAITRMIAETDRQIDRQIARAILGGVPSERGVICPEGARGCFHEGCDGTGIAEEGGSHWCRWAP